jgi:hypothetical protein
MLFALFSRKNAILYDCTFVRQNFFEKCIVFRFKGKISILSDYVQFVWLNFSKTN